MMLNKYIIHIKYVGGNLLAQKVHFIDLYHHHHWHRHHRHYECNLSVSAATTMDTITMHGA